MLGFFGFSIAALVLLAYAFSAKNLASTSNKNFNVEPYYAAYLILVVAMWVWAISTQLGYESLKKGVILGDVLLLVSTVLLTRTITPKKYLNLVTFISIAVSVVAIAYRAKNLNPYMKDSVLVFNTPRIFGAFLVLVLLVVWLRANTKFYRIIVLKKSGAEVLRPIYFSSNLIGYISVCGFLFAKKSLTIAFAFSMLILSFLILYLLNLYALGQSNKGVAHARK